MTNLHLSGNKLSSLPAEVGDWTLMTDLNLDFNQLTSLPAEVGNWTSLTKLFISGTKLTMLPTEVGNWLALGYLSLFDNPICPLELVNLSAEEVVSFYRRMAAGEPVQSYLQRIMIVGKSGKGKTSLRMRLMDGKPPEVLGVDERTYGIDIHQWQQSSLFVERGNQRHEVSIEFWDFAGQPEFYPTHQMFMRSGALYWIVFSWKDDLHATITSENFFSHLFFDRKK
jgi:internalin A